MALLKRSFTAALLDEGDDPSYPFKMPGSLARTTAPVAKMMRLWNYKQGSGLGAHGQGIIAPIKAIRHCSTAGIGHSVTTYKNGLHGAPAPAPPAQDEWHESVAVLRALRLERECCEKTLPRIAVKAREWEPLWSPGCDHWLRLWIPLIGHLPESLYGTVEGKISGGSLDIVSPWKDYFSPTQWEIFSRRHILPKLTRWLQQLKITPPKQRNTKFREVMSWTPLVRTEDVVSILEQEFFGKWESALRHWLQSARPPSGEAAAWCAGWKNLFTPELLHDERVLPRLEAGVAMVDREAEDLNRLVCST